MPCPAAPASRAVRSSASKGDAGVSYRDPMQHHEFEINLQRRHTDRQSSPKRHDAALSFSEVDIAELSHFPLHRSRSSDFHPAQPVSPTISGG